MVEYLKCLWHSLVKDQEQLTSLQLRLRSADLAVYITTETSSTKALYRYFHPRSLNLCA